MNMYYVYILKSQKDNSYYIGSTSNINKRFQQHNNGYSKYTKDKKPWIIMKIEKYNNRSLAYRREMFIKRKKSRKAIEKILFS